MKIHRFPSWAWQLIALVIIVAAGVALRFAQLDRFPPALYPDEAFYGTAALRGLATGHFQIYYPEQHSGEGLLVWLDAPIIAALGTQPWVLRVQPALIGSLSLLAMFGCAYEFARSFVRAPPIGRLSAKAAIALFSTLFLSLSTWHLHLSRLGFRAIYVPLFVIVVLWSWLAARRRGSSILYLLCGVLSGLSLYTYPSARIVPIAVVALFALEFLSTRMSRKRGLANDSGRFRWSDLIAWSVACVAVAAPLIQYFFAHPDEFLSRYNEVGLGSAGSAGSFVFQVLRSTGRTAQSFFFFGDGNWRHNVSDAPQLHPFIAMLFIAGLIAVARKGPALTQMQPFGTVVLIVVLVSMSAPVIVTVDAIPHALRSSGMLPPIVIIAAIGATVLLERTWSFFESRAISRFSVTAAIVSAALMLGQSTAYEYFWLWGQNPKTRYAFFGDLTDLANQIDRLPLARAKYVVTDDSGAPELAVMVQPIAFVTATATSTAQDRRRLHYLTIPGLRAAPPDDHGIYFLIEGARAERNWLHQNAPNAEIHELEKTRPEFNALAMKNCPEDAAISNCR